MQKTELSTTINSDVEGARELSLDEIDNVNGGILPLVAVAVAFAAGYILGSESCTC